MWITLTRADFKASGWNALNGAALASAAMGVSLTINQTVHRFFKIEPGSYKSHATRACSFLAGVTVSHYLMPHTTLQSVAGRKVAELFAMSLLTGIIPPVSGFFGTVTGGAFMGWTGWRGFLWMNGVGGALLGALAHTKNQ